MKINMEEMESDELFYNGYTVKFKAEKWISLRTRRKELEISILMTGDIDASHSRPFCKKMEMTFVDWNTYYHCQRSLYNVAFRRPAAYLSCWTVSVETIAHCFEENLLSLLIKIEG